MSWSTTRKFGAIERSATEGVASEFTIAECAIGEMGRFQIRVSEIAIRENRLVSSDIGKITRRKINVDERAAEFGVAQVGVTEGTILELGM